MVFIVSLLLLIVLRRNEVVALSDYELCMLSLICEAISIIYLILAKFIKPFEK